MTDAWANFFVVQAGASAALLGLLFVGVSLNLQKILTLEGIPDRALLAMLLLLGVLVVSSALLIPGQSPGIVGVEVVAAGVAVWSVGSVVEFRSLTSGAGLGVRGVVSAALFQASAVPDLVAGVYIAYGDWSGLYWLAGSIIISIIKAATDAWVLLVEINR